MACLKLEDMAILKNRITDLIRRCGTHGAVEKVLAAQKSNRLRHPITQTTCRGRLACLPLSTVQNNRNRLRHLVLVSINWMDECINRDGRCVTGRIRPPIEPVGQSAVMMSAPTVRGYFFNNPTCLSNLVINSVPS